ncbi:hypothetical protein AAFF_G00195450 [Aldrovandia affinis]|uniref:Uncharacterized protein n=1 Tax=Aldrovandia affinis TaxID=143900 RepID=A0AAD7RJ19_9TELE|nr:hypothetical protein AAFF_G00195450 [Aldrovandia affinis]
MSSGDTEQRAAAPERRAAAPERRSAAPEQRAATRSSERQPQSGERQPQSGERTCDITTALFPLPSQKHSAPPETIKSHFSTRRHLILDRWRVAARLGATCAQIAILHAPEHWQARGLRRCDSRTPQPRSLPARTAASGGAGSAKSQRHGDGRKGGGAG